MATAYLSPGVYVEEVDRGSKPIEGVGTAVAAFIGFAEKGPVGQPTLVTNWSQFTNTFGSFVKGGYLAPSLYGYFNNGGGTAYVTRLAGEISTNGRNGHTSAKAPVMAALPAHTAGGLPSLEFTALDPGTAPGDISIDIRPAEQGAPDDQFTVVIKRGDADAETFPNVTFGKARGGRNVVEVVNRESKLVKVAEKETSGTLVERIPVAGTYPLARVETTQLATAASVLPTVAPKDFIGEAADRTGIMGLEVTDNVTMVCVPDLMAAYQAGRVSDEGVRAVQTAMMNHCEAMRDRVAVIDCPPGLNPQQIREWRLNIAGYDSKYAAMYYPWIRVSDPSGESDSISLPPSGHMAGVWARNDNERGVHKAPANEVIRGALGLDFQVSRNEQDTLNPVGVNCIRAFPGRGIRVWGARTLSSDPAWRYLNVRRLFNYVEKSIDGGTQWVVFEPNDMDLWGRVRRNVGAFLTRLWADGALFGASSNEAFFVKCDAELNTEDVRDAGQLIVEIGIAPVKPAEFVIFRISQYSSAPA
jgi:phage tail sheath protein FI